MKSPIFKLVILICLSFMSCMKDDARIKDISVNDLKSIIEKNENVQLLDVRTPSETKGGMILNAMQVNLISNEFEVKAVDILDKKKPVYVYCRSGRRSKIAASVLADNGYTVFNILGGYKEWVEQNKKDE